MAAQTITIPIEEELYSYDGQTLLGTYRTQTNALCLAIALAEDESGFKDSYFSVQIDEQLLQDLKDSKVPLRDGLLQGREPKIIVVDGLPYGDELRVIEQHVVTKVKEDYLPSPGLYMWL